MAGFAKPELRLAQPSGWVDQLAALLARELAPSSRKFRTAFRLTTIATLGAGLVAICHVNNELGTYIVWLLVGAGPMMFVRKAAAFLIAEALALISSVVMARTLAETAERSGVPAQPIAKLCATAWRCPHDLRCNDAILRT